MKDFLIIIKQLLIAILAIIFFVIFIKISISEGVKSCAPQGENETIKCQINGYLNKTIN